MSKKKIIIIVSIILLVIVICALATFFIIKSKNNLDARLVKSITVYSIDSNTKEWNKTMTKEYTYEKEYPVSLEIHDYINDNVAKNTFEYEFDNNNKAKTMKKYDNDKVIELSTEYADGKIMKVDTWNTDSTVKRTTFFQYEEDNQYFNLVLHSSHKNSSDQSENSDFDEINSISIKNKNGLLNKTVNKGLYTKARENDTKEWVRFNGTYTVNYDENGIISSTESIYRDDHPVDKLKYDLKIENGKVVESIKYVWDALEEKWQPEEKVVFEYTDTKISNERYADMINANIIEDENNFYIYRWY